MALFPSGTGNLLTRNLSLDDITQSIQVALRPEGIALDGDGFGEATAFNAWMEPGALPVRVPAQN